MNAFNNTESYNHAVEIVKAALGSGTMKLMGTGGGSSGFAKVDADYINAVINSIASNLQSK